MYRRTFRLLFPTVGGPTEDNPDDAMRDASVLGLLFFKSQRGVK